MQISPQFIKQIIDTKKRTIYLLVFTLCICYIHNYISIVIFITTYLLYPKYSNVAFMIKSIKTLTIHCLDIRWATERDTALFIYVILYLLSKAFDCLLHDLLLAKLNAYGFDYKSLKLISKQQEILNKN